MFSKTKPKLLPVQVPWSVAADTSYLQLIASELPAKAEVRFVGFFVTTEQLATSEGFPAIGIRKAERLYSPYESNIHQGPKTGPDQLVKIAFTSAIQALIAPSFSDASAINYDAFDCSAMAFHPGQPVNDAGEWLRCFRDKWAESGMCPDPHMYEVGDSKWVSERAAERGFKHFIIAGHDAYVEIIATGWTWESEGSIRQ